MPSWLPVPRSIESLRVYDRHKFLADLIAGITVGLVALPLAMAFAIASGVPPQYGIYTAIVAGFIVSALGGSVAQIGGPTGAFVVVVYGIIAKHGIDGLYMCTLMAGVMLLLLGLTGLGTAVRFIPRPVVIGFTNGIAVLIASTQIKDFFGLKIENVPGEFIGRMRAILENFRTLSVAETTLAAISLAIIVLCMRYVKRVPGAIAAMIIGTGIAVALKLPVETIATRFHGIPTGLPALHIPQFHFDLVLPLLSSAVTVAMLGAIESLLSAVVADRMTNDRHNPNMELIAQGVANIFSPMFGGLPATGAIARTATNIRSGAKTPVAGMLHAITLLVVLLVAAPLAGHIPLSVLAAILMVVSYNMGEWAELPKMLRASISERFIWLITFALTVFADLTVAVEFGMIIAALVFIRSVAMTTTVSEVTEKYLEDGRVHVLQDKEIPSYVSILRIHGPFLFGATEKMQAIHERISELQPVVLLRLRNMTALDTTGLKAIEHLAEALHATGRTLILCGAMEQPARMMRRAEFQEIVGKENICANVAQALERARVVYPHVAPLEVKRQWNRRAEDRKSDAASAK
jgi:sulfate permease, SulP family